jgi:undecaprenyl-diphosphatase
MISVLEALLLGLVQGITEWLPVSSSGHLVVVQKLLGLEGSVAYDVLLHVATLIVIVAVFWKDIAKILPALIKLDFRSEYGRLALFIVLASIPTAVIGYVFRDFFVSLFSNLLVVGVALIANGVLLFSTKFAKAVKKVNYKDSVLIGIVQGIAIIPGISRSGSTISVGLLRGIKKTDAARFSFLLAIPAIIGAAGLEFKSLYITSAEIFPVAIGMVAAMVVGYLSLKFLLSIVMRGKFNLFSCYCWIVGLIIIFLAIF